MVSTTSTSSQPRRSPTITIHSRFLQMGLIRRQCRYSRANSCADGDNSCCCCCCCCDSCSVTVIISSAARREAAREPKAKKNQDRMIPTRSRRKRTATSTTTTTTTATATTMDRNSRRKIVRNNVSCCFAWTISIVALILLLHMTSPTHCYSTTIQRKTPFARTKYLFHHKHIQPVRRTVLHESSNGSNENNHDPSTTNNNNNDSNNNHNNKIPRHVAFICDGNSRWAQARGLPASAGHVAGADQLLNLLQSVKESGVSYCTLYAFSTENWNRPASEIRDLLRIMEECGRRMYPRILRERVRVKVVGDLDDARIPTSLRTLLRQLERDSTQPQQQQQQQQQFTVCFALNYGGRNDILQASVQLAKLVANQQLALENVTEQVLASLLSTRDIPDPDLIVRTSGECRLSNFMLWNAAYAELYFTPVLWPDFDDTAWQQALQWYSNRQRKFGGRDLTSHDNNNNGNEWHQQEQQQQQQQQAMVHESPIVAKKNGAATGASTPPQ